MGVVSPPNRTNPAAPSATWRERKKATTRATIAAAAFDLVRDQGPEALTAEAIAERAGVSRRTFFNYFPSVDAAVAGSIESLLDDLTEMLSDRPADEPIWDTIEALMTGPHGTAIVERVAVLGATADRSRLANHLARDHAEAFVGWLTSWLTARLAAPTPSMDSVAGAAGSPSRTVTDRAPVADASTPHQPSSPDPDLYAATLAGSVVAAAEAALRLWLERTGGTVTSTSLSTYQDLFAQALTLVRAGFERHAP